MSDPITRDELAAELRAVRADSTAQFQQMIGEMRASQAELRGDINTFRAEIGGKIDVASAKAAGKWTVWGAAGTIVVAIAATLIALVQVAQTAYDTGRGSVKDTLPAAEQAVAGPKAVPAR